MRSRIASSPVGPPASAFALMSQRWLVCHSGPPTMFSSSTLYASRISSRSGRLAMRRLPSGAGTIWGMIVAGFDGSAGALALTETTSNRAGAGDCGAAAGDWADTGVVADVNASRLPTQTTSASFFINVLWCDGWDLLTRVPARL